MEQPAKFVQECPDCDDTISGQQQQQQQNEMRRLGMENVFKLKFPKGQNNQTIYSISELIYIK